MLNTFSISLIAVFLSVITVNNHTLKNPAWGMTCYKLLSRVLVGDRAIMVVVYILRKMVKDGDEVEHLYIAIFGKTGQIDIYNCLLNDSSNGRYAVPGHEFSCPKRVIAKLGVGWSIWFKSTTILIDWSYSVTVSGTQIITVCILAISANENSVFS